MDLWLNSAKNRKFWDERELKVIPELPLPTSTCHVIIIKHETQCASQDHTLRRKWKLQRTAEYCKTNFEEFDIVMFDITSKSKLFYKEKSRMQKRRAFHLISKHWCNIHFLCIFFMNKKRREEA